MGGQIDLREGTVRLEVGETKNDEGRILFIDDETKEMFLRRWRNRKRPLPWVFLNAHGTDRMKRFYKARRAACQRAGFYGKLFLNHVRTC
jgi:integrase